MGDESWGNAFKVSVCRWLAVPESEVSADLGLGYILNVSRTITSFRLAEWSELSSEDRNGYFSCIRRRRAFSFSPCCELHLRLQKDVKRRPSYPNHVPKRYGGVLATRATLILALCV
jgi:hypothetical protein